MVIIYIMKKGYTYILECSDGSYYTGSTIDLLKRFMEHQAGKGANHTKKRLPVKLIYFEEYPTVQEAFYREKQIQGWSRKKKEALIKSEYNKLKALAECRNETHYKNKGGFDSAQPPSNSAQPPSNSAQPPSDSAQPPSNSAQPPSNSAQPPSNSAQTQSNSAQPPSDSD